MKEKIMSRHNYMRLALSCLVLLLSMQIFGAQKNKTVSYPLIEMSNNYTLDITKIELTKHATILHVNAYYFPHDWIRLASGTYLKADDKKYRMTGAEGIQPDSLFWMPESGETSFKLQFEPLPMNTQTCDFYETDSEDGWRLYGIDLTGKKTFDKPEGLPENVADVPLPDTMPDPILACGETTVRLHILNYRPEYNIKAVDMYVNTMLGKQEPYELKTDPTTGEAEIRFQQYGSAHSFFLINQRTVAKAWLAPGETTDIYVDLRAERSTFFNAMHRADLKSTPQQPTPLQGAYTTGTYAGLNRFGNQLDNTSAHYSLNLHSGTFADYKMTSAEYADHVIECYQATAEKIAQNNLSGLTKEYQLLSLQQEVCEAITDGDYLRSLNYRSLQNQWDSEVPADTIDPLKPEDARKIAALFNVYNLKLLMGNNILNYIRAISSAQWINTEEMPNGLIKDLRQTIGYVEMAENAQLTEEQFATLKAMDTPIFYDMFNLMQKEAKKKIANMPGKVAETPDVPVEQLFEAIIAPHKGKVIMVDFWNTWCGPCRAAIKHNEPLKSGALRDDNLIWIYIANETSPLADYAGMIPNIQGIHYRLNKEQWRFLCEQQFDIDGIPSYVMVDKWGKADLRNDLRDHNLLIKTLQKALAE